MAKEVMMREAAAEAVAAAAEANAGRVAEAFAERFKAYLPKKQAAPDMGTALLAVAAALRGAAADLVSKSEAHDAELADDAAPRDARDSANAELIQALVPIRAATETVYGRAGLKALGIEGRTPTDPKAVQEHARKLVKQLEDPKVKLPKPQEGVSVNKAVWLAKLKKPLGVLAQARKDVAREEREAQITGNAKTKAMDAFDDVFGVAASFTSTMLELIGEDDLAARVKPSPRRRGVTAEVEENDESTPEAAAQVSDSPLDAAEAGPTK